MSCVHVVMVNSHCYLHEDIMRPNYRQRWLKITGSWLMFWLRFSSDSDNDGSRPSVCKLGTARILSGAHVPDIRFQWSLRLGEEGRKQVCCPSLFIVWPAHIGICRIWHDSMILPSYVALASVLVLVLNVIFASRRVQQFWARMTRGESQENEVDERPSVPRNETNIANDFSHHVEQHGGARVFSFQVLRLLSCSALLGLSIYIAMQDEDSAVNVLRKKGRHGKKHRHKDRHQLSDREWMDLLSTMTYVRCRLVLSH